MPSFDFQITRNAELVDINITVAAINFNNNSLNANLHYSSPLGEPASRSVNFDSAELIQAAADAGEDPAVFLNSFKAIIEQATVTKFGDPAP